MFCYNIIIIVLTGKGLKNMKKFLAMALGFSIIFTTTSCGSKKDISENNPANESQQIEVEKPKYNDGNDRPIAIMIDNDGSDSWPHSGLDDAYLIYEMYVEGGATRLMALFKGKDTKKIGPVRSARHYYFDFAFEHDAMYTAFGWSPRAGAELPKIGLDFINGIKGSDYKYFWREEKYRGDYHSVYTSIEKLKQGAEDKGYEMTTDKKFMEYNDEFTPIKGGYSALSIKIPYAGFYSVTYNYDETTKTYKRTLNSNTPHQSPEGVPYAPTNIIIQKAKNYNLNDGSQRQHIETVGSGDAIYITGGQAMDIKWSKASRKERTIYTDLNGNEIKLNPAQTFINIVPPSMTLTIQ